MQYQFPHQLVQITVGIFNCLTFQSDDSFYICSLHRAHEPGRSFLCSFSRKKQSQKVNEKFSSSLSHTWNVKCVGSFLYRWLSDIYFFCTVMFTQFLIPSIGRQMDRSVDIADPKKKIWKICWNGQLNGKLNFYYLHCPSSFAIHRAFSDSQSDLIKLSEVGKKSINFWSVTLEPSRVRDRRDERLRMIKKATADWRARSSRRHRWWFLIFRWSALNPSNLIRNIYWKKKQRRITQFTIHPIRIHFAYLFDGLNGGWIFRVFDTNQEEEKSQVEVARIPM